MVHHRGDVVVRDAGPWLNAKLYDDIDAAWMIRQRRALETALARGSRL